ncbi:hypothetical protein EDD36DRAFT_301046 [Exophiala viscosa]|uniref:NmrA-like domain-containing protein n=1 Tax=Exophiala viscosa TaxID=2486360 RepID=A0AAN6DTU5_9EURO|nr:hypothetical protein EDD36DRAFT_301046 [Exophiala viscosa]
MSNILAVFGATGQQGGSVIAYVLNEPELSQKYEIRAITRDVNSIKAKALKDKSEVDVVQGDALDRASLMTALTGVHTIFAMTTPSFGEGSTEVEDKGAKNIADVAVEKGVEYIIFSTLPFVSEISGGKNIKVFPFDAKAKAAQYIRSLPIKSAFYCPGSFMQNFQAQPFLAPRKAPDGSWVMARNTSPSTQYPLVDAVGDTGKFVGAILAEPDKYEGKTFCAAQALYTLEEIVAIISKPTGETVLYKQIPDEDFKKTLPPPVADMLSEAFSFGEEFGYFGPDTEKLVAWAAENARGRLTTLEEYLEAHPLRLA